MRDNIGHATPTVSAKNGNSVPLITPTNAPNNDEAHNIPHNILTCLHAFASLKQSTRSSPNSKIFIGYKKLITLIMAIMSIIAKAPLNVDNFIFVLVYKGILLNQSVPDTLHYVFQHFPPLF